LLDFQETLEERRLPVLGKIPLFRWRRKSRGDQELLFLISPRLVEIQDTADNPPLPPVDAARIRLPELQWPGDRDDWRNAFEPMPLTAEGVPPSFLHDAPIKPIEPAEIAAAGRVDLTAAIHDFARTV